MKLIKILPILAIVFFSMSCKNFKDYIKDMKSSDSDTRIEAAEFLGESRDPRALPVLLDGLDDINDSVKIACIGAIAKLGITSKQASKKIFDLIDIKKPELVVASLNALADLRYKEVADELVEYLNNSNVDIRKAASYCFTKIVTKNALKDLIGLLNDKEEQIRANAAKALGFMGSNDTKLALRTALKSEKSPIVLENIILSLSNMRDKDAINTILNYLENENESVRAASFQALGGFNDKKIISNIMIGLDDESPKVKIQSLRALSKYKEEEIFDIVKPLSTDDDSEVRALSLSILSKFTKKDELETILLRGLSDDDDIVRAKAAEGLSKVENFSVIKPLLEAAEDSSSTVRQFAVYALGKKGNMEALELLIDTLEDEDIAMIRANAAYALGNINSYSAIPYLIKALTSDESPQVRYQSINALSKFENSVGISKFIIRALKKDDNETVRKTAAEALSHYAKDQAAIKALEQAIKNDVSFFVRKTAFDSLDKMGFEVKGLKEYLNEPKREIDLSKEDESEYDEYDKGDDFDLIEEVQNFYFIKSTIGQFIIYVITVLFLVSLAYIINLIIKYSVYEYYQMYKMKRIINANSHISYKNELFERLLKGISRQSIIYQRIDDIYEIDNKGGKINHSLMAELLASKEISRFRIAFIRYSTTVFVVLGLIGTFWGVSEMVLKFDKLLSQLDTNDLQTLLNSMVDAVYNMKNVLVGMQTAFSTSIFGLISMVVIGLFNFLLSWVQNNFLIRVEESTQKHILPIIK